MQLFEPRSSHSPKIYAYTDPSPKYKGLIKIGYTEQEVADRMKQHYPTAAPIGIKQYEVVLEESSMRNDGTSFKDHLVHKILIDAGIKRVGGEWFECSVDTLKSAIIAAKMRKTIDLDRVMDFQLRPEQEAAVTVTKKYFQTYTMSEEEPPHFLWNCKMRFGKTFAAYKLAQEMKWDKILILTYWPAVENSWKDDLLTHKDFNDWQFISNSTKSYEEIDHTQPFACFASFQDFLGKNKAGGLKLKNKWAHQIKWDCVILDEYHYGAWREHARELTQAEDKKEQNASQINSMDDWNESISPIKTEHYLYLSGTPFRAIQSGEFLESQIYNWTYSDEQKAKEEWTGDNNPYSSLPRMVMMVYQLPESITQLTDTDEYNEFDLNEFFRADGLEDHAKFKHENYVQRWLDLIRGAGFNNIYANLKLGKKKPVLPFGDAKLLDNLMHTFWLLPSVAACYAMKNLLMRPSNIFYHDYEIIVCAGNKAGIGVRALGPVLEKMNDPLKSKTITLSCGKLTTGVTVRPWTGVFMLRDTSTPETYFQSAFRVQSPWTIPLENSPNNEIIQKKNCYVFDFAPNRALRLLTNYSSDLHPDQGNAESDLEEFIKFLPVVSFDGSSMTQLNADEILTFASAGTSMSQLARKFESSRLVNVDTFTLSRLLANQEAVDSLMNIEGFRNLNQELVKIVNSTEKINELKRSANDKDLNTRQKKTLSEAEKQQKSLRRQIQEKLQKFATRIPVFMYLTDYREHALKDVITQLEPALFTRVTGLSVKQFELLLSLGLFNSTYMNDAVKQFKWSENASLQYDGFTKHEPRTIGLFDTVLTTEEFHGL